MMRFNSSQRGSTLIEVLVTIVLLAFGLLGIAVFQSKAQIGTLESYQRAQAVLLLEDMRARINSNVQNADAYVSTTVFGVPDTPADCSTVAAGAARDTCEWSRALKGAGETNTADSTSVGAMAGARGCIELIQTRNNTDRFCIPGIYQVSVAWQGNHETQAPSLRCGSGAYGNERLRRAIAVRVVVATSGCKLI